MKTDTILLILIPCLLLAFIVWYSVRSDKSHEAVQSDEDDEYLTDPLTGKKISVQEAEDGFTISEDEEKSLLEKVNFEEVEIEKIEEADQQSGKNKDQV